MQRRDGPVLLPCCLVAVLYHLKKVVPKRRCRRPKLLNKGDIDEHGSESMTQAVLLEQLGRDPFQR